MIQSITKTKAGCYVELATPQGTFGFDFDAAELSAGVDFRALALAQTVQAMALASEATEGESVQVQALESKQVDPITGATTIQLTYARSEEVKPLAVK